LTFTFHPLFKILKRTPSIVTSMEPDAYIDPIRLLDCVLEITHTAPYHSEAHVCGHTEDSVCMYENHWPRASQNGEGRWWSMTYLVANCSGISTLREFTRFQKDNQTGRPKWRNLLMFQQKWTLQYYFPSSGFILALNITFGMRTGTSLSRENQ